MDERAKHRTKLDSRYVRLLERISSGTSGSIWLAQKKESKEICALKVVRKDLLQSTAGVDTWSRAFCTTDSERHNFILSLDGSLNTRSSIVLLTPYVAGGDLQSYVQQNGKLAMATARFYAAELCHAIEFLHGKGLIHRNLGLEHVLLTACGHIRVTGFGVCKGGMEAKSRTATFCGGIALAPEMLLDQPYGRPVDWWAFGILLFEMLEAASPFRGENMDEIYDEILDSTKPEYPLEMPEVVKSILRQLLLRNPDKRLGTDATGAERVKAHAFFEGINWDDVAQERILPPLLPAVTDHTDAIEADCEAPAIPPATLSHNMDGHATFSDF